MFSRTGAQEQFITANFEVTGGRSTADNSVHMDHVQRRYASLF